MNEGMIAHMRTTSFDDAFWMAMFDIFEAALMTAAMGL